MQELNRSQRGWEPGALRERNRAHREPFPAALHPMCRITPHEVRMDARLEPDAHTSPPVLNAQRPTRQEAEDAVRTLIRWAGDDPAREGLAATPARVARAYEEWFSGYADDPEQVLQRCFEETGGYDEMVLLRGIRFASFCEHHMAPIAGKATIAYLPERRVMGISKLVRLVHAFAKRLQIQERMTAEIADTLDRVLRPRGVAVVVEARHGCMNSRGVRACGARLVTTRFLGAFRESAQARCEFLAAAGVAGAGSSFAGEGG